MRARLGRWLAVTVFAGVALIVVVLFAAHTSWARARVLSWATAFVSRYELSLNAGSLDYNALTRRVTLADVRLSAIGHEDHPFLLAKRIEVTLPWSVYRRRFAMDHLDIESGVVDILRDASGQTNLPPGSKGPSPATARRLDIRGITFKPLDLRYVDLQHDFDLTLPGIEAELSRGHQAPHEGAPYDSGSFAVRGRTAIRLKTRTLTLAPIDAKMNFDGSNVTLNEMRFLAPELNAVLSGTIHRVLDATSFELALNGIVNLEPATMWAPPPVPASGVVNIAGTITGPFTLPVTDLRVTGDAVSIGNERNIAIDGPVRVTMDAFTGEGMVLKPASGGEIRAAFSVPWGPQPPSSAGARWKSLDAQSAFRLGAFATERIGAAFEGVGTFEFGPIRRYDISNRSTARASQGVVPLSGELHATLVGDAWSIEHSHQVPGLAFDGKTAGRIDNRTIAATTLAGPAHTHLMDVADAARSLTTLGIDMPAIASRIHGAVDAQLTLAGSFRDPHVDAFVTADAVELPLVGTTKANAHVVADRRLATISSIEATHGSATVNGDIAADIVKGTWSGTLHAEAPDATELEGGVPGTWRVNGPIAATVRLGGTFNAFQLDTEINGSAFTWAAQPFDGFTARALVTADGINVSTLHIDQGKGSVTGRVSYNWDSSAYDAKVEGKGLTYRTSLIADNDTLATFDMQFTGAGTVEHPSGTGQADFAITGGTAGALIGQGALTLDLLGDHARYQVRVPSLGALLNGTLSTSSPYEYTAAAALNHVELEPLAALAGAEPGGVLGFVSGSVLVSGRLADDQNRSAYMNLQSVDALVGSIPLTLQSPARVSLAGDAITLEDLNMRVGAGQLAATGKWSTRLDGKFHGKFTGELQDAVRMGRAFGLPVSMDGTGALAVDFISAGDRAHTTATLTLQDGAVFWGSATPIARNLTINADLNGEALTVSSITGRLSSAGAIGDFSASARLKVPALELQAITGDLTIDTAALSLSGVPVSQDRPSRVEFAKGLLSVADATWRIADRSLTFGGSVDLAAKPSAALDLSAKGVLDLRVLSAFTSGVAFDGTAAVDAGIKGTIAAPKLAGRITIEEAEVATSEPRINLSELSGHLLLDGSQVIVEDLHASANGGTISVSGPVDVSGLTIAGGALSIQAQGVAIEYPAGLRSEVDALVTLNPNLKAPALTGDVRASQGSYTQPISLASFARKAATPFTRFEEASYLDRLRLNVTVTTTEDASIDNNYGRFEAGAALRIVGTVAEPGMTGRITLREGGQLFLAGRTFRLTRGDISFTDLRHITPEFNISADARISNYTATMTLTGTVEHPTFDLTSDDGAKTPGELAVDVVGGGITTENALTLLSADLLGVTGRAIGLDTLRVDRGDLTDSAFREDPSQIANEADPATRLTIAKRLSDQVEVTLSQNLRESGKATFIVSYFPKSNVEVRALSRDNATLGLGIRHQVTLGGGKVRTVRTERAVISAITFMDVEPALEKEARAQLKLREGDQFEFIGLQKDIDRLRASLHAQGYFEARVRAKHVTSEDGKSAELTYRVERGPKTTLEIRGIQLPASEKRALEGAWTSSVFDQFLIDDLTNRVRRYLLNTGEIVSVVVARVDKGPGTKRVRIEVTPGAPVSAREVRFTGNTALNATRLKNEMIGAGLEREAWLDPSLLERALRSVYAEEGYLRAAVTAQPLDFDGTVGVLPVSIVEGPQSTIASITWNGVAENRKDLVAKAAGIEVGQAFRNSRVSDAREQVETRYRAEGFNAVEIDIRPDTQDDRSIALAFDVVEGPQQVLSEVETTGTHVTDAGVITGALRLETGKPVNLDDWAKARKRLYDTNVFRQVDVEAVPVGDPKDGVQPVNARVTVQEFPQWALRYGAQIEGDRTPTIGEFVTSKNLGLVSELKNPNLFGQALTFGVFGQYQYDTQQATTYLSTSRLFGWPARSSLYGFVSRARERDPDTRDVLYVQNRTGASVEQRWKLRGMQAVYGYRFERDRTYDPNYAPNDIFPQLDFVSNLARLSSAVLLDRRENPLDPHTGTFSSISVDQSAVLLGSDVTNRKLFAQQYVFVPVGRQVVLATRAQSGTVFGPDELLPSDRFNAGGATTVRGYGEDALGPRSFDNVPLGGETIFVFNQEMRFRIYRWVRGVAFVDAGNVFAHDEPFEWNQIRVGYGGGFRFDTPVGLLRVDYGIPQSLVTSTRTRQPNSVSGGRWYFGLGHIF